MRTDLFDYNLPPELIAQTPAPRAHSRLLVLHRQEGQVEHRCFSDILGYLQAGDTLVLNDTRVIARRLTGTMVTGSTVEILLMRPLNHLQWEVLTRPGRSVRIGKVITLTGPLPCEEPLEARVVGVTPEGGRILEFESSQARDLVGTWGATPLPPYIKTPLPPEQEERYQTVYARVDGSVAAPTAGLHFTTEMLHQVRDRGVAIATVTLHIGIDTFRPVKVDDTDAHEMHGEWVSVSQTAAEIINRTTGRIIAVGTTSVRALETAAQAALPLSETLHNPASSTEKSGRRVEQQDNPLSLSNRRRIEAFIGESRLFITPGYTFRSVDALITNFHLPKSTLLMLISALATREQILQAYEEAVRERYRFFSFGDAMLIV